MTRLLAAAAASLLSLTAVAQEPRFGEKIEVRLIEIDVIVTDREGKRVYGLTADDFEIFEGRARQTITNFTEHRPEPADAVAQPPARTPVPAERGNVLVLIDILPRGGFVRSETFKHLDHLVSRLTAEGDRVGIVLWEPGLERLASIIEVTSDVEAVRLAVATLAGTVRAQRAANAEAQDAEQLRDFFDDAQAAGAARGVTVDVQAQNESSERFGSELSLMMFRRKTAAMRRLIGSFGAQPGKKSLLYVSNSFALPGEPSARLAAVGMVEELAKSANAAGVTIYAARPNVPDKEEGGEAELFRHRETLRRLTDATGGTLDFGLPSVGTVGADVAEDLESYYSIAYRARSDGRDRERRITVKPKNRQYRVRARRSFVEKSDETMARDTLLARLFSEQDGGDIEFDVEEGEPRRSARNRWLLPLDLRIPVGQLEFAPERGQSVAHVKILIVAGNGVAEVTNVTEDDLRVVERADTDEGFITYSVQLLSDSRGSVVSIGVFDRRRGLLGVRTIDNRAKFK